MKKRYHAANIVQTFHLGTEGRLLVEIAVHEIAVLLCCYSTHSMDTDATRMTDHLAHHVLGHFILVSADREVSVAPLTPVSTVGQGEKGFLDIIQEKC